MDDSQQSENTKYFQKLFQDSEKRLDNSMSQIESLLAERKKYFVLVKNLKKNIKADTFSAIESFEFISSFLVKKDMSYSVKVAKLAMAISDEMDLSEELTKYVEVIARLHLTGMIFTDYSEDEFRLYPEKSVFLIEKFSGLKKIATVFPDLDEFFDGSGPNSKKGKSVKPEIRVVRTAAFYYYLYHKKKKDKEIIRELDQSSGRSLDPVAVSALYRVLLRKDFFSDFDIFALSLKDLEPGMKLETAVFSKNGAMLLPAGTVLNKELINKIAAYDRGEPVVDSILVKT
ncbi:MAG: hypothetical protein ACQEQS_05640 [Thermodesulfobacteriota bacterium]